MNRENLLRRPDGELFVVDLAGAFWFRPGGLAHRLFFRLFASVDESAFLKWKVKLAPGSLDADEQQRYRRLRGWRRLWIFNKKVPTAIKRR
jgi:hypothetical protein